MQDAASRLLRLSWKDVRMISVDEGLLVFSLRGQPSFRIRAETRDIPHLIGLIRGE
jgi:hypothetical protein